MQLKISDEKLVALADKAEVQGQIVVHEDALAFVLRIDFVVDHVASGH